MKNILFISLNDHVPWGGSEVLWSQTAAYLSAQLAVGALVKKWEKEAEGIAQLKTQGVQVYYKNRKSTEIAFKELFRKKLAKKLGIRETTPPKTDLFLDSDIDINPDLVVLSLGNHLDVSVLEWADFLQERDIPYVVVFQLVTDLRGRTDDILNRFKECYANAERLFLLSEENREKLNLQLGAHFTNFDFIDNPFEYKRQHIEIVEKSEFHLASVAALNSFHKGHDILVHTLALEKWRNRPIHINLYGDGHNKEQLQRLVKIYGIEVKISFHNYISDKSEIWKQNQGLLMPSRMEGQSLSMLEAMSFERFIISTKVGAAEELIVHGETGYLIPAATSELLDETLELAWSNREKWLEMGSRSADYLFQKIRKDPVVAFSEKIIELL
jgi:glycosyltransferase involved in cell wall biosynthesis